MTRLSPLPMVMVAPNGARRTKADHPALPMTIGETVEAAGRAFAEGAGALHAHVRDARGKHSLDAGLYRELIAEMERMVPGMPVQITTESAGSFSPEVQREVVREVRPEGVSVALREMWPDRGDDADARRFYRWAEDHDIAVQHILYSPEEATRLASIVDSGWLPRRLQCLFVLGSYVPEAEGRPGEIPAFLQSLAPIGPELDWAVCAFGSSETACLREAVGLGGKIRIGFENNLNDEDGRPATDNAMRVRQVLSTLPEEHFPGRSGTGSPPQLQDH